MKRLTTYLMLCLTMSALAGGDDGGSAATETLLDDQWPNQQGTAPSPSKESYLDAARSHAERMRALQNEREHIAEQLKIARLRKECSDYGSYCDMVISLEPNVTVTTFNPSVTGISGKHVRIRTDSDKHRWFSVGETYQGYVITAVNLDTVVFRKDDHLIQVQVNDANAF